MRQIWQMSSFVTTAILALAFQLPAQTAKQAETTAPAADSRAKSAATADVTTSTSVQTGKNASAVTIAAKPAAATFSTTPARRAMKAKSLAMPLFFEANKGQADPSV